MVNLKLKNKLKNKLKEDAESIKKCKKEYKKYWREHGPIRYCYDDYYNKVWSKMMDIFGCLKKLKEEYRYHHIAYSIMKGKTLDKIERNSKKPLDYSCVEKIIKNWEDEK